MTKQRCWKEAVFSLFLILALSLTMRGLANQGSPLTSLPMLEGMVLEAHFNESDELLQLHLGLPGAGDSERLCFSPSVDDGTAYELHPWLSCSLPKQVKDGYTLNLVSSNGTEEVFEQYHLSREQLIQWLQEDKETSVAYSSLASTVNYAVHASMLAVHPVEVFKKWQRLSHGKNCCGKPFSTQQVMKETFFLFTYLAGFVFHGYEVTSLAWGWNTSGWIHFLGEKSLLPLSIFYRRVDCNCRSKWFNLHNLMILLNGVYVTMGIGRFRLGF